MIPIKLTLKNFMSYGDPAVVVPFEGLHVACLSGDNGNGKSAILDGMTYALWGRTRGSSVKSVSEDDLIRLGSDEMEVRFEFDLNGLRYRATRKRRRGKASASEWNLAALTEGGSWNAIGGGSQRETGRQIVKLLSMEYDTFLNSAYLQQGRADEFTRQTPDSRKRILGEILGLDRYDRLEEKAKERLKARREAAEELEGQIRLLEGQIGRREQYEAQLEETRAALTQAEGELKAQEEKTATLRDRRSRLDALADQAAQGEAQRKRMAEEIAIRERERCTQIEKLGRLKQVIEQQDVIRSDFAGLQRAVARRVVLEPEIEAFNRATADLNTVRGVIDIEKHKLDSDVRLAENQVAQAEEKRKERERLLALQAKLERELEGTETLEADLAHAQEAQQAVQQEFEELKAANKRCGEDLEEIGEVLELLARPQAVCPVCESDLSGAKHARVLERQEAKREALARQQQQMQQRGREMKQEQAAAVAQTAALTSKRDEATARRQRLADTAARLGTMQGIEEEWRRLTKQVQTLVDRLQQGDFAAPQRLRRQSLEKEIERLGLARIEYDAVKQQIARLESSQRRHQELEQAERHWQLEQETLERLELLIAARRAEQAKEEAGLKAQREKLARHAEVAAATDAAETELRRLQAACNARRVMEGSLLRYLADCDVAEAECKQKAEQHRKIDEERRLYLALTVAFGKKGVQTLIIENVIPEVEQEANALLARMTDNAMQLLFETTRTAKGGGHEIETLDIKVNDEAGARPYELFSGGEAFRINFAIRIALSRLLARRSGARLQTLIMDEGFGSQDGKGREKLVEVIETIKDDFEKILVITHVEELKDAFAQRIEITKDAAGSHVHLL